MSENQSSKNNSVLKDAWQKFSDYDMNSINIKGNFECLQNWILLLGGAVTLMALLYTQLFDIKPISSLSRLKAVLHYVIIITPILISIMVTASNRFSLGKKWLFLRYAAEEIKGEIYRYRVLSNFSDGSDTSLYFKERIKKLREKINEVSIWLLETEVSIMYIKSYKGPFPPENNSKLNGPYGKGLICSCLSEFKKMVIDLYRKLKTKESSEDIEEDNAMEDMSPEKYIKFRIDDQLSFYSRKASVLQMKLKIYSWLIFIMGGIGTFLAAVGYNLWVPMSTSLAGIFTTFLEYRQVESTLMLYNQTRTSLEGVKGWWFDLSADEQSKYDIVKKLVDSTEQILQTELSRWLQNMKNALDNLKKKQSDGTKSEEENKND